MRQKQDCVVKQALNAINSNKSNMTLVDYESIMKQSKSKVFQVALGGAGDPNKHENFDEILALTRAYGIIPNMTTSGHNITDMEINSIRRYCGAVAVSFYSRLMKNDYNTCIGGVIYPFILRMMLLNE